MRSWSCWPAASALLSYLCLSFKNSTQNPIKVIINEAIQPIKKLCFQVANLKNVKKNGIPDSQDIINDEKGIVKIPPIIPKNIDVIKQSNTSILYSTGISYL